MSQSDAAFAGGLPRAGLKTAAGASDAEGRAHGGASRPAAGKRARQCSVLAAPSPAPPPTPDRGRPGTRALCPPTHLWPLGIPTLPGCVSASPRLLPSGPAGPPLPQQVDSRGGGSVYLEHCVPAGPAVAFGPGAFRSSLVAEGEGVRGSELRGTSPARHAAAAGAHPLASTRRSSLRAPSRCLQNSSGQRALRWGSGLSPDTR